MSTGAGSTSFSYDIAFSRNLGLTQPEEQQALRNSKVAIAGMGGVGGIHLITLARLGIGKFHIADFDQFELHNFNRQSGAMMSTLDAAKAETMRDMVLDINPEADVTVFNEGVTPDNTDRFFAGVDVAIDGLDYFAVEARDVFYKEAVRSRTPVVVAGPIGCSAASLIFMPGKMTWHEYFAMDLARSDFDKYVLFALGTAPKATHMNYMDRSYVDMEAHKAPSLSAAVQLCAGVAATEALKILLKRGNVRPAPHYAQFDPYKGKYVRGKLRWGNKGPLQRLKFAIFRRLYRPKSGA